jgi:hypothetical protein
MDGPDSSHASIHVWRTSKNGEYSKSGKKKGFASIFIEANP